MQMGKFIATIVYVDDHINISNNKDTLDAL
jgi:hypothetical protein